MGRAGHRTLAMVRWVTARRKLAPKRGRWTSRAAAHHFLQLVAPAKTARSASAVRFLCLQELKRGGGLTGVLASGVVGLTALEVVEVFANGSSPIFFPTKPLSENGGGYRATVFRACKLRFSEPKALERYGTGGCQVM